MAIISADKPSTLHFIKKYATMFDERVIVPTYEYLGVISQRSPLEHHVTLREGAPVMQLLEAPPDFVQGSAEPWIVDIVCSLLVASGARTVLETGTFVGATALRLCQTLNDHQGGTFIGCEIEADRAQTSQARLEAANLTNVDWRIYQQDVLGVIAAQPPESLGLVWVDDNHEQDHVAKETDLLLTRMKPGGLICFHDVWGSCDLQKIVKHFGGIALDLPRLGPAGGLGIIQA